MIKPQVLEVTCRNGHSLRCEPTKAKKTKRYICDGKRNGCHKNLTTGDKIYSCRACNYDLCSSCYETLLNEQFGTTPIKNNIKRQNKQNKKAFRKKKKKGNNNGKKRKGKNCNGTNHGNDNSENKCNSIDKFKSNDRSKAKYLLYNENARLTLTINDNKQEIILNTDQFLKDTIDSEQEEIFENVAVKIDNLSNNKRKKFPFGNFAKVRDYIAKQGPFPNARDLNEHFWGSKVEFANKFAKWFVKRRSQIQQANGTFKKKHGMRKEEKRVSQNQAEKECDRARDIHFEKAKMNSHLNDNIYYDYQIGNVVNYRHIPSYFHGPFEEQKININMVKVKIGYLTVIYIHPNDPNDCPIGLITPNPISSECLSLINFAIHSKKRFDKNIRNILHQIVDYDDTKLTKEERDNLSLNGEKINDINISTWIHNQISLIPANHAWDSRIQLNENEWDKLVQFHQTCFELLDCHKQKNKSYLLRSDQFNTQLRQNINHVIDHGKLNDKLEMLAKNRNVSKGLLLKHNQERQYLICPLVKKRESPPMHGEHSGEHNDERTGERSGGEGEDFDEKKTVEDLEGNVEQQDDLQNLEFEIDWEKINDVYYARCVTQSEVDATDEYWHSKYNKEKKPKLKYTLVKTYSKQYSSSNSNSNNNISNDIDEVKQIEEKLEPGNPCDEENKLYRCSDLKWINKIHVSYGKHAVLTVDDSFAFGDGNNNNNNDNQLQTIGPSAISKTLREYFLEFGKKLKSKNKACLITRPITPDNIPNVVMHHKKHKTIKFSQQAKLRDYKPLEMVYPTGISSRFWYQLLNIPSILFKIENLMAFYDLKNYLRDGKRIVRSNSDNNIYINDAISTITTMNKHVKIAKIGIHIDFELIREALSTSSAGMGTSNKELQLFGDAVLDFCAILHLMTNYRNEKMNRWGAMFPAVVSNENLLRCGNNIGNYNGNGGMHMRGFNLAEFGAFKEFSWQCWHPALFWPRINSFHLNQNVGKEPFAGNVESLIGACFLTHCSPYILKYDNDNNNNNNNNLPDYILKQNNQGEKPDVRVYQPGCNYDDNVSERHLSDGEQSDLESSDTSGSDMDLCDDDDDEEAVSNNGRIPSVVTARSVDHITNAEQKIGILELQSQARGESIPVEQAFTQCFQLLDFLGVWEQWNIKNNNDNNGNNNDDNNDNNNDNDSNNDSSDDHKADMAVDIGIGNIILANKHIETIKRHIQNITTLIGYDFDCNQKFDGDVLGSYRFSEHTLGFAMILAVVDQAKECYHITHIDVDEIDKSYISLKRISFSKFEFIGDALLKLYVTYVLFAYFKEKAKNSNNECDNDHDSKEAKEDIISYKIGLKMRSTKRLNNEITNERKKWISNKHLANQICKHGIDTCIVWGPKNKRQTKNVADVFEALLGAIFWHSNWRLLLHNAGGTKEDLLLNFEPCIKFCEKFLGMSESLDFKQFDWDGWKNTNNCRFSKFRPTLQEFIGTTIYQ